MSLLAGLAFLCLSTTDVRVEGAQAGTPDHQATGTAEWRDRLERWRKAVEVHQPGEIDDSATEIGSWRGIDVEDVVADVVKFRTALAAGYEKLRADPSAPGILYRGQALSLAEAVQLLGLTDREATDGNIDRLLARGALLHTDILFLLSHSVNESGATSRSVVLSFDGVERGYRTTGVHLEIARTLLAEMRPSESNARVVRVWYHLAATYLLRHRMLAEADPHLRRGLQMFDRDRDLLFDSGCLNEMYAAPRVQVVVQADRSKYDVGSAQTHWQRAESFFRRATAIAPPDPDLLVHAGRVAGLLGRHEEASRTLRRAIATASDPLLLYYADLFLGDEEQALGHREAARKCYENAATRYPAAQAPHLALGQLARRFGDRRTAVAAVEKAFAAAGEPRVSDPSLEYPLVSFRNTDAAAAAWRASLLSGEWR